MLTMLINHFTTLCVICIICVICVIGQCCGLILVSLYFQSTIPPFLLSNINKKHKAKLLHYSTETNLIIKTFSLLAQFTPIH